MKKVIGVILMLIVMICAFGCKTRKTMQTSCQVCGKNAMCYEVSYHKVDNKSFKEKYWVCSKDCEKYLDQLATMGGGVKE